VHETEAPGAHTFAVPPPPPHPTKTATRIATPIVERTIPFASIAGDGVVPKAAASVSHGAVEGVHDAGLPRRDRCYALTASLRAAILWAEEATMTHAGIALASLVRIASETSTRA
jgi:hypothetical protein